MQKQGSDAALLGCADVLAPSVQRRWRGWRQRVGGGVWRFSGMCKCDERAVADVFLSIFLLLSQVKWLV